MSGIYKDGETKVRPGSYYRTTTADVRGAEKIKGIVAVLFRSDFGALKSPVELYSEKEIVPLFGSGQTVDAVEEAFIGGAKKIIACRVGNGGIPTMVTLNDVDSSAVVTITAKYPGKRDFTVTVRDSLDNIADREVIIYEGVQIFERFTFAKGGNESGSLVESMRESKYFDASADSENKVLADTMQTVFTAGTNPTATAEDYSEALEMLELYDYDTVCLDTEDTTIHQLMAVYVDRIYDAGKLVMGVVAETKDVQLKNRMEHAAAFNNEKMHYILNDNIMAGAREMKGYQTAAMIAGMIASVESNVSLTHTALTGVTAIVERLTPSQMVEAEKSGCIVLSYSPGKKVWIDNAINTLVLPADNQDDGWKKIRRTKTRFELIRRVNETIENLIGKVDNDTNGRATIIAQIQDIGTAMVEEGKLIFCQVEENGEYTPDGDSAWFEIDVVDKDSMEHIYMTYQFQFSTNV